MIIYRQNFIGGKRVSPRDEGEYEVRSPYDGELLGRVPLAGYADIERALREARSTFDQGRWSSIPFATRLQIMRRFWQIYLDKWDDLADLVSRENGIPIGFSSLVVERLQRYLGPFFDAAESWESPGVVAAFSPWYGPQEAALETLIPAMLAGCTAVLVLTPETALDGQVLGDLFAEAGLWDGVLSIVVADREKHDFIAAHPAIDTFSYYGSQAETRRFASFGRDQPKRFLLHVRGKPGAIVLPDADLELTSEQVAHASFSANGVCKTNYTRLIVPRHMQVDFGAALKEKVSALSFGDPLEPVTFFGPALSEVIVTAFRDAVAASVEERATYLCGGVRSGHSGAVFLEPTLLGDARRGMMAVEKEIQGPFVAIMPYGDIDEAIALANEHSVQRLSAVWTSDVPLGQAIGKKLTAETVLLHQVPK